MENRLLFLSLSALLICSTVKAADNKTLIECYVGEEKFAMNSECQVGFYVEKIDGCPVLNSSIRFSDVGRRLNKKESSTVTLDRCRFDGDMLVCNCDTDHCNKDANIISGLISKTNFDLPNGCEAKLKIGVGEFVGSWKNNTGRTETTEPRIVWCKNSRLGLYEPGEFCVTEVTVIPGTCLITGSPVLTAANSTEELCTKQNVIKITCTTEDCSTDLETMKDGIAVSGGAHIPNCKKDLLFTIGSTFENNKSVSTTEAPVTTTKVTVPVITTTTELPTTKYIPKKICTRDPKSPQYAMAFIIDGSYITMQNTQNRSLSGILSFVKSATSLLQQKDRVYIEAYGGQRDSSERRSAVVCNYVKSSKYELKDVDAEIEHIRQTLESSYNNKTAGDRGFRDDTVIVCGFSESNYSSTLFARSFFQNDTTSTARVTIHIGSGIVTGAWDYDFTSGAIDKLKSQRVHLINIAPKWGNTKQMKTWSSNPETDYFEVEDLDEKFLNIDLAKKILHAECNK